jgi:hypothetical protein
LTCQWCRIHFAEAVRNHDIAARRNFKHIGHCLRAWAISNQRSNVSDPIDGRTRPFPQSKWSQHVRRKHTFGILPCCRGVRRGTPPTLPSLHRLTELGFGVQDRIYLETTEIRPREHVRNGFVREQTVPYRNNPPASFSAHWVVGVLAVCTQTARVCGELMDP